MPSQASIRWRAPKAPWAFWNETMQAAGKLPPALTLFLHTPTFFKSTQTYSLTPYPSPLLVFSSLADR
jgi:hypothetical protein